MILNLFHWKKQLKKLINKVLKSFSDSRYTCQIIKENKDLISHFVHNDFNNALSNSQYPNGLKYADVTPAFKKDNKSDKSKVYERIMQNQIYP